MISADVSAPVNVSDAQVRFKAGPADNARQSTTQYSDTRRYGAELQEEAGYFPSAHGSAISVSPIETGESLDRGASTSSRPAGEHNADTHSIHGTGASITNHSDGRLLDGLERWRDRCRRGEFAEVDHP